MAPTWRETREVLIGQLVPLVEASLASDRLSIIPALFQNDSRRRRILLTLNMNKIVRHLWGAIRDENTTALTPVFDSERPRSEAPATCCRGSRGPRGLTRSTPTSTAACTTARGKRAKPSRSPVIRAWSPG